MPISNKDRQSALRLRREALGLKRRDYFLNEYEKIKVDAYVNKIIEKRNKNLVNVLTKKVKKT